MLFRGHWLLPVGLWTFDASGNLIIQLVCCSCEEFASRGCIVYATARRLDAMQGFSHPDIHTLALDVTNDDNVREVVQAVVAREGRIDILVNNAGIGKRGDLALCT